jgi:hypothetical protein
LAILASEWQRKQPGKSKERRKNLTIFSIVHMLILENRGELGIFIHVQTIVAPDTRCLCWAVLSAEGKCNSRPTAIALPFPLLVFLLKGGSMLHRFFSKIIICLTIGLVAVVITAIGWGQETRGRVNITVLDPQQALVPGAALELVDLATNEVRTATTQSAGTYTFINLPPGKYS